MVSGGISWRVKVGNLIGNDGKWLTIVKESNHPPKFKSLSLRHSPMKNRGVFLVSEPKLELGFPIPDSGDATYTQYPFGEATGVAAVLFDHVMIFGVAP